VPSPPSIAFIPRLPSRASYPPPLPSLLLLLVFLATYSPLSHPIATPRKAPLCGASPAIHLVEPRTSPTSFDEADVAVTAAMERSTFVGPCPSVERAVERDDSLPSSPLKITYYQNHELIVDVVRGNARAPSHGLGGVATATREQQQR